MSRPRDHGDVVDLTGVLRPVRQGNAFEETVERLLTVVKLGLVAPGEKFPAERDLAAQLGISRITLREALRALNQAGYVEPRRGRFGGTFVTRVPPAPDRADLRRRATEDADELADALRFRLAVETGAAVVLAGLLAAPGGGQGPDSALARDGDMSRDGSQPLRDILLVRLAEVNNAGPEDYRRLDARFHLAIAELTGSSLLAAACADARMRLNDLLNAIPVLRHNIEHTSEQHAAIVAALLAGNADLARRAVAEHLDGTAALLRGFLG